MREIKKNSKTNDIKTSVGKGTEFGAIIRNSSKNYPKTGNWSEKKPSVGSLCVGCGICVGICPENAIHIDKKRAIVNFEYCKGCGICAKVCPKKAISI